MLRFILKLNTYKNPSLMILIGVFLFTGTENNSDKKQYQFFYDPKVIKNEEFDVSFYNKHAR